MSATLCYKNNELRYYDLANPNVVIIDSEDVISMIVTRRVDIKHVDISRLMLPNLHYLSTNSVVIGLDKMLRHCSKLEKCRANITTDDWFILPNLPDCEVELKIHGGRCYDFTASPQAIISQYPFSTQLGWTAPCLYIRLFCATTGLSADVIEVDKIDIIATKGFLGCQHLICNQDLIEDFLEFSYIVRHNTRSIFERDVGSLYQYLGVRNPYAVTKAVNRR